MLTCTSYKWYIFPRHYWAHLANGSFWLFLFIFPVNTYLFSSCFHSEFANAWQWWCPLACLQPLEQHNFLRFLAVMDDDNEKTKINKIRLVGLTLEKRKINDVFRKKALFLESNKNSLLSHLQEEKICHIFNLLHWWW